MQHTSQPEVLVSPGDLTLPHCPPSASQRCSRLPLGQEMRKYLMFSDFIDPDYGQHDTDPDYGQHETETARRRERLDDSSEQDYF